MRFWSLVIVCCSLLMSSVAAAGTVPDEEWNDEVKLWLARSVLGEVGWRRSAEYTAVAYVYAVRAEQSKTRDFLELMKRYSAAIRSPGKRRNPWLFNLGLDDTRPAEWPEGPQWRGLHDEAWLETLQWADDWQAGRFENPCPGANHFGGWVDHHRAEQARWKTIKCSVKTRNRFYTSLVLQR